MNLQKEAKISAYDPKAMTEAKEHYFKNNPSISYSEKYDITENADALILLTEGKNFDRLTLMNLKHTSTMQLFLMAEINTTHLI